MEGQRRKEQGDWEVDRGFVSSRLERQILVRVYELVVPVIRRSVSGGQLVTQPERMTEEYDSPLAKGA